MSSEQYLSTINEYKEIINSVNSLYVYIENCENIISKCKPLVEETIIDGEAIDKKLLINIELSLNQLMNNLAKVIGECNSKIDINNSLYQSSLAKEEEEKIEE